MDAAIILIFALFTLFKVTVSVPAAQPAPDIEVDDVKRVAKVNDSYYNDPKAFTSISRALGFPKEVDV